MTGAEENELLDLGLTSEDFEELGVGHRQTFQKLQPVIAYLLKKQYSKKAIWRFLCKRKGMTMCYPHFLRYVNSSLLDTSFDDRPRNLKIEKDRKTEADLPREKSPEKEETLKKEPTPERVPIFERSATAEKPQPSVSESGSTERKPGTLLHNPRAKSLREYAYGKDDS